MSLFLFTGCCHVDADYAADSHRLHFSHKMMMPRADIFSTRRWSHDKHRRRAAAAATTRRRECLQRVRNASSPSSSRPRRTYYQSVMPLARPSAFHRRRRHEPNISRKSALSRCLRCGRYSSWSLRLPKSVSEAPPMEKPRHAPKLPLAGSLQRRRRYLRPRFSMMIARKPPAIISAAAFCCSKSA